MIRWPDNRFMQALRTRLPLIQAPMAGGATTPELVAAVSNSGALGSLAAGYLQPGAITTAIQHIRKLTASPFAVNLFIPENHAATAYQMEAARKAVQKCCAELNFTVDSPKPPYAPHFEEQIAALLEEEVPAISFTFGVLAKPWIDECKNRGIVLMGTATTLEEAQALEEEQIDLVVAQGSEAGGHRGTFLGKAEEALNSTASLVTTLQGKIKIPVIAAGGIMNAQGIVSALKQGAAGVQMGTAFLCCPESGIHPDYKNALLRAEKNQTALTRAFSGKLARGLGNLFMTRMQSHAIDILDYPIQNALTSPMRKEAVKQGKLDFMSLFAGKGAHLCSISSAADLIRQWEKEIESLLAR